jgi:hypothetical protein
LRFLRDLAQWTWRTLEVTCWEPGKREIGGIKNDTGVSFGQSRRSLNRGGHRVTSGKGGGEATQAFSMSSSSASLFDLFKDQKSLFLQLLLRVRDRRSFLLGITGILGLIVVLYAARNFASPYRKLPPGPRGYPIIGNILENGAGQWLKFSEWQKKYGEFMDPNSYFAHF